MNTPGRLLRILFGSGEAVWEEITLRTNLTHLLSLTGIMALPVVSYLLCAGSDLSLALDFQFSFPIMQHYVGE